MNSRAKWWSWKTALFHWEKLRLSPMRSSNHPFKWHLKMAIRQESISLIAWPKTFLQNSRTKYTLLKVNYPRLVVHVIAQNTSRAMKSSINLRRRGLTPERRGITRLMRSRLHQERLMKESTKNLRKETKRRRKRLGIDMQGMMRNNRRVIASGRRGKRKKSEWPL